MKLTGLTFLVGEPVKMSVVRFVCKRPISNLRDRIIGFCSHCLRENDVTVGIILVVDRPTAAARWN